MNKYGLKKEKIGRLLSEDKKISSDKNSYKISSTATIALRPPVTDRIKTIYGSLHTSPAKNIKAPEVKLTEVLHKEKPIDKRTQKVKTSSPKISLEEIMIFKDAILSPSTQGKTTSRQRFTSNETLDSKGVGWEALTPRKADLKGASKNINTENEIKEDGGKLRAKLESLQMQMDLNKEAFENERNRTKEAYEKEVKRSEDERRRTQEVYDSLIIKSEEALYTERKRNEDERKRNEDERKRNEDERKRNEDERKRTQEAHENERRLFKEAFEIAMKRSQEALENERKAKEDLQAEVKELKKKLENFQLLTFNKKLDTENNK